MTVEAAPAVDTRRRNRREAHRVGAAPHAVKTRIVKGNGVEPPTIPDPELPPRLNPQTHQPHPAPPLPQHLDWVIAAVSLGNPLATIERELGAVCGSVSGYLLSDRTAALRYSIALVEAAKIPDDHASRLLEAARGKGVKDRICRSLLNQANALRARAEADRRLSEAIARKAHDLIGTREKVGAREAAREAKAAASAAMMAQVHAITDGPKALARAAFRHRAAEISGTSTNGTSSAHDPRHTLGDATNFISADRTTEAAVVEIEVSAIPEQPPAIVELLSRQPAELPPDGVAMYDHCISIATWLDEAITVYAKHRLSIPSHACMEALANVTAYLDEEDRRAAMSEEADDE